MKRKFLSFLSQHFSETKGCFQLRSILYVPAEERRLRKISRLEYKPDAFCLDLEDSISYDYKEKARGLLKDFIRDVLPSFDNKPKIYARVNVEPELIKKDLNTVLCEEVDGIVFSKIQTRKDLDDFFDLLAETEKEKDLMVGSTKVISQIETAKAVFNIKEIVFPTNKRVDCICLGGDDYAMDMRITRNLVDPVEEEMKYVRNVMSVSARACNLQCLDTPYVNFKDEIGLRKECEYVKSIGMTGKFAIHPSQIKTINEVFSVSLGEYLEAKRIVKTYEKSSGATYTETNRMVDQPVYKRYKQIVEDFEKNN